MKVGRGRKSVGGACRRGVREVSEEGACSVGTAPSPSPTPAGHAHAPERVAARRGKIAGGVVENELPRRRGEDARGSSACDLGPAAPGRPAYALRRLRSFAATPASPVPKSSIVTGSGTGLVVCCAPPIRICATSSTFVIVIATFVVNATLLIRCPLMAVMVKKFSPLAPSA